MKTKPPFTYALLFAAIVCLALFDLLLLKRTQYLKARLSEASVYNTVLQLRLKELTPQRALVPDLTLQDLHGEEFHLDRLNSKLTVLIFFSVSDCPVCLEEAAFWEEIKVDFSPKGVNVVGVGEAYGKQDLERFVAVKKLSFPVLFDKDFKVKRQFGDFITPAKVILNSRKEILFIQSATTDIDEQVHAQREFEKVLTELLATNSKGLR